MQSNLISELSAETPGLVLHGRICRKWKPRNPNTDRVLRLDMICLDRKGDAVWIQVPKSCMDRFDQRVEEQNTYRIANFKVVAETKGYRPVPNGLFVELESTSTIEPTPDHVPPFPTQCFRFLKHEDMFPNRDQRTILLDVVGQLLEFSKTKSSTSINRNSKRKEIKIMLPEFRVQVSVNDPTGEAVFVLFDGEGKKFFGISAQALYADKENEPSDVPAALLTIEHMEVEFHIKVKEFNVKKSSHEFTVWKINEAKESANSTTKISEPIQENTLSSQQGGGSTHSISTSTVVDIEDEDFDTTNRSNLELRHNENASATPSTNNLKRKQRADSGNDDSDV
ncbi:unnamed protein product [Linum trigynum]|uniref:Uncharacterized protein n=1 Tax=Linum trigynum TaxID=586398 RepID=A0AAV2FNW8_9ROSI